ncbi:MAG: HlyD family efflux transporter periplasmic adaptor subunit [Betaproteobacteria bacterium]|jgi:membrane fusion protein|nr:MAG: HlyD family efflux transporter periplasmic adaptor subunit [Betaproteobacteria bacterium]
MNAPESPAPAHRPRSLFRQEAIDAQREKLLGELSTARPVPLWIFTLLAVAFAVVFVVFAFVGEYTRRERVEGFLVGDAGAARIFSSDPGVVTELLVKEGDEVEKDSPIARLKLEHSQSGGGSTSQQVEQQMLNRRRGIESEQAQAKLIGQQQLVQQRKRIDDLLQEMDQARAEAEVQEQRAASAQQEMHRFEKLGKDGFASEAMVRERRNDMLDQQSKLENLKRAQSTAGRELGSAQAELPLIEMRTRNDVQRLEQQKSEIEQELLQNKAKQEIVINATISGVITNIVPNQGDSVAANALLATVLPNGTSLHAQLLVPTRAIGFIAPGNGVVMRYDAFPFQRFGQYHGTVASVSRTVWTPGEKIGPLTAREPVYRIDVKLQRQTVSAGNREFPLRPGMLASADILLEKRTVFEWVFEPVLALRERLR